MVLVSYFSPSPFFLSWFAKCSSSMAKSSKRAWNKSLPTFPAFIKTRQTFQRDILTCSASQNTVQLPKSRRLWNIRINSSAFLHSIQIILVKMYKSGLSQSGGQVSTQNSCRGMKSYKTCRQTKRITVTTWDKFCVHTGVIME